MKKIDLVIQRRGKRALHWPGLLLVFAVMLVATALADLALQWASHALWESAIDLPRVARRAFLLSAAFVALVSARQWKLSPARASLVSERDAAT